jgi:hypothetical protein
MFFYLNRTDRTGSILQTMFYVYAFCYKYNLVYDGLICNHAWWYNAKFFNYVENYFGIKNKIIKDKSKLKSIDFNELINDKENKKYNNDDILILYNVTNHNTYFRNNINYYFDTKFISSLNFKKIINNNNPYIAVHIRRGDVNNNIKLRYTNDEVYINLIKKIININPSVNYEIHIFSEYKFNGNKKLFEIFPNLHFHLEKNSGFHDYDNIFNDLMLMINSDIFICSKSSFSYFPALLKEKGQVYHNNKFWNPPLDRFLVYDDTTGEIVE